MSKLSLNFTRNTKKKMASKAKKARGNLSAREAAAIKAGLPMPYTTKAKTTTKKATTQKSSSGVDLSIPKVDTSQLKALQGKYQETIAPTADETNTETQLGNIITSKELGVAKAEQEPMAQGFVTGQSAALEKSAALKSLPLQTRLADLQSRRQSAADVLKAQLGFETGNVDRQTQLAESARARALQQEESAANRAYQEKTFAESQRQFNVGQAKTSDKNSFSNYITSLSSLVMTGKLSGEGAKDLLKRKFPDMDENIIYQYIPDFYEKQKSAQQSDWK